MPITPPSTPPSPEPPALALDHNDLADVFYDSPPLSPARVSARSDIPRLRSTHTTAGDREGFNDSNPHNLQPGFDQGYGFGAAFGLEVGCIVGTLEGLF